MCCKTLNLMTLPNREAIFLLCFGFCFCGERDNKHAGQNDEDTAKLRESKTVAHDENTGQNGDYSRKVGEQRYGGGADVVVGIVEKEKSADGGNEGEIDQRQTEAGRLQGEENGGDVSAVFQESQHREYTAS